MENSCLICLDENKLDTLLLCCNKYVHSSCIKQWWDLNNILIEEATCPHCQQLVKIKKINNLKEINLKEISTSIQNPNKYNIEEPLNIRPNIIFQLTDEEINTINNNPKNEIPKNMFHHNENYHLESNLCLGFMYDCLDRFKIFIILTIIIVIIIIYIL
tara:strand:- start:291 stop:767 length:477 start_codon:yes stop_codon:yes gene_type:complete